MIPPHVELDTCGAEAMPFGLAEITRLRQSHNQASAQNSCEARELELVGLVAIIRRLVKP